MKTNKLKA